MEPSHTQRSIDVALKEWSVTIDAMLSGEQVLLLRKGGIRETDRHFRLAADRFLLFPTLYHEVERHIRPEFHKTCGFGADVADSTVQIKAFATVAETISVEDFSQLERLKGFHVWSDEFVEKRIRWKPRHPALLMLVRTYALPEPVVVDIENHHKGCKSWVDIRPPIETSDATPIYSEVEFRSIRENLIVSLREPGSRLAVTS